jgi:predicted nuclease with TOPRIM domain
MAIDLFIRMRSELRTCEEYMTKVLKENKELLEENARLRARIEDLTKQKREA